MRNDRNRDRSAGANTTSDRADTIELANGCSGYIPTPEQHKLGGYETWPARSSFLETGAAPKIQAALMSLFQQLR